MLGVHRPDGAVALATPDAGVNAALEMAVGVDTGIKAGTGTKTKEQRVPNGARLL